MDPIAVIADDELTAVRLLVHRAHHAIDEGRLRVAAGMAHLAKENGPGSSAPGPRSAA